MTFDAEAFKQRMAKRRESMKRFASTTKFKDGANRIRLLPGWRPGDEISWDLNFAMHFVKDSAGQMVERYVCKQHTFGESCPVCAAIGQANKHVTDDATQKLIADAKASPVILCNALMLDSSEPMTPVILELKQSVWTAIDALVQLNGPEIFFSLDRGHELVVTRSGTGLNTKYTVSPAMTPGAPIPPAVLTKLHNLDEYIKQNTDEKERKAVAGVHALVGIGAAAASSAQALGATPQTSPAALAAPASTGPIVAPVVQPTVRVPQAAGVVRPGVQTPAMDEELSDLLGETSMGANGA